MNDTATRKGRVRAAALLTGGVLAGAVLAGAVSANAATTSPSTTSTTSSSSSSSTSAPAQGTFNPGGTTPVRSDEKSVSADLTASLTAKALAQVSGGTVIRVETDSGDAAYEVHMKKSDGSLVTVKFDKNLAVTAVEDGMGKGDPAPAGAPAGGPAGAPSSGSSTSGTA